MVVGFWADVRAGMEVYNLPECRWCHVRRPADQIVETYGKCICWSCIALCSRILAARRDAAMLAAAAEGRAEGEVLVPYRRPAAVSPRLTPSVRGRHPGGGGDGPPAP
jgi:hypothetical protein